MTKTLLLPLIIMALFSCNTDQQSAMNRIEKVAQPSAAEAPEDATKCTPKVVWKLNHDEIMASACHDKHSGHVYITVEDVNQNCLFVDTLNGCAYQYDTIIDINFDGQPDWCYESYSCTGCCPRTEITYRLNRGNFQFDAPKSILNAYFDQKRKAVYYMGYGHRVMLQKAIWENDQLVDVEHVYTDEGTLFMNDYGGTEEILQEIPKEYTNIPQYDWAIRDWNEKE